MAKRPTEMETSFMRLFSASKSMAAPGRRRPTHAPLACCLAALLAAGATGAQANCPEGPGPAITTARSRYAADTLRFDVLRNGHRVGAHTVRFLDEAGALHVESSMELRLKLWFIEAYHFRYRSTETWCNDRLSQLLAETDDNGTVTEVAAAWSATPAEPVPASPTKLVPEGVFPTTHWNRAALDGGAVLNTVSGQVNRVAVRQCRDPSLRLGRAAACREFTGDLQAQVWYDEAGRWHALAFDGRDGSRIEYRLAPHATDP